jgi:hypothetical protein
VKNPETVLLRLERFDRRRKQQRTLNPEIRQVVENGAKTAEKFPRYDRLLNIDRQRDQIRRNFAI